MPDQVAPDLSCVPYPKKGLYLALTIPFLLMLLVVAVYLWIAHPLLSVLFIVLYLLVCWFQAYCCVHQSCPYVGGFCPGIAGIIPASLFAKFLSRRLKRPVSRRAFEAFAAIAFSCWVGLAIFPVFWISKQSGWLATAYVLAHVIYAVVFVFSICPVCCAIRATCPAGVLSGRLRRRGTRG